MPHHYLSANPNQTFMLILVIQLHILSVAGEERSFRPVILCLVQSHYSFKWELIYLQGVINNVDVSWNYWGGSCSFLSEKCDSLNISCNIQTSPLIICIFSLCSWKLQNTYRPATVARIYKWTFDWIEQKIIIILENIVSVLMCPVSAISQ